MPFPKAEVAKQLALPALKPMAASFEGHRDPSEVFQDYNDYVTHGLRPPIPLVREVNGVMELITRSHLERKAFAANQASQPPVKLLGRRPSRFLKAQTTMPPNPAPWSANDFWNYYSPQERQGWLGGAVPEQGAEYWGQRELPPEVLQAFERMGQLP